MPDVVWTPDEHVLARANVVRLMRRHGIEGYRELVRRSQEEPEWFWPAASRTSASTSPVRGSGSTTTRAAPSGRPGSPARRSRSRTTASTAARASAPKRVGAVFAGEDGVAARATRSPSSRRDVTRLAEGLVGLGVEPGDRVAIYLPMCPEVAVASHACAHVGAVQVPLFSGFAAPAVARAPPGRRGEGRHHRRLLAAPRQHGSPMRETVESRPCAEAPVRRARRHLGAGRGLGRDRETRAPASYRRSRSTASIRTSSPTRPARPAAEGRPPRPGRLSRLDHARGRLPGGRAPGRRAPLLHRHGLDHGAVDGGGRRRARLHARLRRGRSRLAAVDGSGGSSSASASRSWASRRRSSGR